VTLRFAILCTLGVALAVFSVAGRGYAEDYRHPKPTHHCTEEESPEWCEGTEGKDFMFGDTAPDRIKGLGGADDIDTQGWSGSFHGGQDLALGGLGNDWLWGGPEKQGLYGEGGRDKLWGYAGDDALHAGSGMDVAYGGKGNDFILGYGNSVTDPGDAEDTLDGGPGDDELEGGLGRDTVLGREGSDTLYGDYDTGGDPSFPHTAQADVIRGGEGTDRLHGGFGADRIYGSGDKFTTDYIYCDEGNGDIAYAGPRDKVAWSCEKVKGGPFSRI
jgi:Ca2+-binding RTX toxin-like protein